MPNYDNISKLRDYLIETPPADFDMDKWDRCLAGYACRVLDGDRAMPQPPMMAEARAGRELLGLDVETSILLFDSIRLDGSKQPADLDCAIERLSSLLGDEEMRA